MPKAIETKQYETMLPQGMQSRYAKLLSSLDALDTLPADGADVTNAEVNLCRQSLQLAQQNLEQFVAYRKMAGFDHD
jgi:hypothetical protein